MRLFLISGAALMALYIAAYYLTVSAVNPPSRLGIYQPPAKPEYSYYNRLSKIVFYPIFKIDTILRPSVWRGTLSEYRPKSE
jgi:hypothetical protein